MLLGPTNVVAGKKGRPRHLLLARARLHGGGNRVPISQLVGPLRQHIPSTGAFACRRRGHARDDSRPPALQRLWTVLWRGGGGHDAGRGGRLPLLRPGLSPRLKKKPWLKGRDLSSRFKSFAEGGWTWMNSPKMNQRNGQTRTNSGLRHRTGVIRSLPSSPDGSEWSGTGWLPHRLEPMQSSSPLRVQEPHGKFLIPLST